MNTVEPMTPPPSPGIDVGVFNQPPLLRTVARYLGEDEQTDQHPAEQRHLPTPVGPDLVILLHLREQVEAAGQLP